VLDSIEDKGLKPNDYPMQYEFEDAFPDEVLGLPPKRDIDFTIDLLLGATLVCKAPYRMSNPELV